MKITHLDLPGAAVIELNPFKDVRGYFMRSYDRAAFAEAGLPTEWMQANESYSVQRGTLRGMHFQRPPHTEAKLVRAIVGVVMDVFVDLRRHSPTFGQWRAVELDAGKKNMVLVPRGCAHSFCTMTEDSLVGYLVDNAYHGAAEGGVRWNDPQLDIPWPLAGPPVISDKDASWPLLRDIEPLDLEVAG
ncbi:dTDP-4-dehydrorhamnose 3,5-epimerase [Dongia sp.]|uniref:dTDP-4-dehydrorhamnose 3,5-epimerase n=1 Tax=Dongia sp. TaxID=1977262 RepID=UPI0035B1D1E7